MSKANAKKSKKSAPVQYRQGDVLLTSRPIPSNSVPVERDEETPLVLQEGELTGHAHRIPSRHAQLYRSESDARYMRVMGPAPVGLIHEEHTEIKIPPGDYEITIHSEYRPGALPRQVAD